MVLYRYPRRDGGTHYEEVISIIKRFGKYAAVQYLGKGNFGEAYLVEKDDKRYCLKAQLCETDEKRNEVQKEVKALYMIPNSEFLLSIHDSFFADGGYYCIVIQFCEGGELESLLQQDLSLAEVKKYLVFA